jgi:hypothetical protein
MATGATRCLRIVFGLFLLTLVLAETNFALAQFGGAKADEVVVLSKPPLTDPADAGPATAARLTVLDVSSQTEKKIYKALDTVCSVEFLGNPLRDVVEFIAQQNSIPILLDKAALKDAGLNGDEEISLVVSGIKLKSALKLILDDVRGAHLVYLVEDEVLKVTTQERARAASPAAGSRWQAGSASGRGAGNHRLFRWQSDRPPELPDARADRNAAEQPAAAGEGGW